MIINTYAHEYSGEKSKYSDNILYNFIKELYLLEQMGNTTLFIVGDHGYVGLFGLYKILGAKDWNIESSLPIFIMIIFDNNNSTYNEQYYNIFKNLYIKHNLFKNKLYLKK